MNSAVKILKHFETPKVQGVYYRLTCLTGDDKGKSYYLLGKRIVMGRSEKCDITILDIKSSREHAEIILVGKEYILTDLASQNGIIINDLKIKQHALTDGDKIIVGKTVYKFSRVEVKENSSTARVARNKTNTIDEEKEDTPVENEKSKKIIIVLLVVIIFAILLLFGDNTKEKTVKKRDEIDIAIKEIDDAFAKAAKERSTEAKKNNEKLSIYFKKGLREYREGNYFRAISEFENAKQWSPNDTLASFYLRKTREKLDEEIEMLFSKGTRDVDAVSYRKASVSYCSIVRLLNNFQTDKRYIAAKEAIKDLEKKIGLEEGEIVCLEKVGDDE